ncbi:DUF1127 domain-containing protein [Mesorhizobium sp. CA8]|uniref:DUF1127 domain-containing protein n=1 Tax=Mesorhizobium sp. CA8 TaxID=2876637 RepID=UPI002961E752|nr:DUF1127 domain-containing protein [Mesorhizobium sp. CA8]
MVTIFYIAPRDESIHIDLAIDKVQSEQGRMTMDTIETIRYTRLAFGAQAEPLANRSFVGRIAVVLRSIARQIDRMLERRRGRLALMEMTDDQLKDIGISRCDAHRESIKAFWE